MGTSFHVPHSGRYALALQMTSAPDYGIFSVTLNGRELRVDVDLYSKKVQLPEPIPLGEIHLEAGEQRLVCKLTGANPNARPFQKDQYLLGLDFIAAVALDPPPTGRRRADAG